MNAGLEKGSLSNGFVWYPKNETKSKEGLESLISSHLSRNILYSRESFIIRFVEDTALKSGVAIWNKWMML